MKIVLVSTTMGIGGAERQVADLAAAYARERHEVVIISLKGPNGQRIARGVRLIEMNASKSAAGLVSLVVRLARTLREIEPDVVHGHMVIANLLTRLVKPLVRWPITISTAHNTYEGGGSLRIVAYRATDLFADLTTNVSREAVEHYVSIGVAKAARIRVMYNGIDFDRFSFCERSRSRLREQWHIADSTVVYLAVGRLVEAKDYPNLLRAFALVSNQRSDVILLIAGDGPERVAIDTMIRALGLDDKVRMLGVRHDIRDLMCCADVFVSSSAWEGFSLVVTEAMACRLPVVATDSGGVSENMGGFGHLVPVRDPGKLADAMAAAVRAGSRLTDPAASDAYAHARARFSIGNVAARWLAVYASLLARRAQ
ncbi:glycosyl transferases group 1 family protein [Burkholderia cenocepacia]|nr:glycosyl transferases group 1 family protein [Burkholderia cenocepacia]